MGFFSQRKAILSVTGALTQQQQLMAKFARENIMGDLLEKYQMLANESKKNPLMGSTGLATLEDTIRRFGGTGINFNELRNGASITDILKALELFEKKKAAPAAARSGGRPSGGISTTTGRATATASKSTSTCSNTRGSSLPPDKSPLATAVQKGSIK